MRAFIFGALNVDNTPVLPQDGDIIIAADGGLETVKRLKLTPTAIIGDFDSLGYTPDGPSVTVLPKRKDDTDVGYAIKTALNAGADEFYIYGASGGRLDHTFANIQLASFLAERNCFNVFFGETNFSAISCGKLKFSEEARGRISVFAINPAVASIAGLSYTVDRFNMENTYPVGVSNEFIGKCAYITIHSGTAAVMWDDKIVPEFA